MTECIKTGILDDHQTAETLSSKIDFWHREASMRSVVISSGHGKLVRGAAGVIDEVNEARLVVDAVAAKLMAAGASVKTFHDDTSTTQSTNLSTIVNYHNRQSRDLDVSVHFNAFQTTSKPMGTEILYVTQQSLASELSKALAGAMALPNRGGKKRNDLYFLNSTNKPSILIETCFVDSSADADAYRKNFDAVCRVIAEFVGDVKIGAQPPAPQPPQPEPPPAGAEAVVDMTIVVDGNAAFNINGQDFTLVEPPTAMLTAEPAKVTMTIGITGSAVVVINGQDFQIEAPPLPVEPPLPPSGAEIWQTNIETTVFGGAADPNNSAYPPYGYIDDKVLGCALPFRLPSNQRRVRARNSADPSKQAVLEVLDLGPWMTTDDYWVDSIRPLAEIYYAESKPLPSGPNKGKVPTNGAGLDLTPAAARALGIGGKGKCDWRFEEEQIDV